MIQQNRVLKFVILEILIFNSCSVYRTKTYIVRIGNEVYQN
jgi:hypothetical protein